MVSEGTKDRLSMVIEVGKTVFHYGWIPSILYIGKPLRNHHDTEPNISPPITGFKTGADPGMPELSIFK